MKSLPIIFACMFVFLYAQAQNAVQDSTPSFVNGVSDHAAYKQLTEHFYANEYGSVIQLADTVLQNSDSSLPPEIYRYLAYSYYQVRNTTQAYQCMARYLDLQDSARITGYDIYLTAQFSARLKKKDSRALGILRKAYEMDTCLQNRKLYAAALVNYYLQTRSQYAPTVWREKLLPLKELDRTEMYRISQAWYKYNQMGNVRDIFGQFTSVYPYAFRSLYTHGEILPEPEQQVD